MFHNHLSYAELSEALSSMFLEQRSLTAQELRALRRSLESPFLQKLLQLYPLPSRLNEILKRSLELMREQEAANRRIHRRDLNQPNIDVHDVVFGGGRERTAAYLKQFYTPSGLMPINDKVDVFLAEIFSDESVNEELILAEAQRYNDRVQRHANRELIFLEKHHSLQEIQEDFTEYSRHLRQMKERGVSYAWPILESIFQRLEGELTEEQRSEACLLLVRALDDSRTAYHTYNTKFVENKNYSCPKGLEERLLDHHQSLTPTSVSRSADLLEKTILELTGPFICHDAAMQQQGCRWTFAPALYQLYLDAAGYRIVHKTLRYYALSESGVIRTLKQEYLATLQGKSPRLQDKAARDFDSLIAIIQAGICEEGSLVYTDVMHFLQNRSAVTVKEKGSAYLEPPKVPKSKEVIQHELLRQGVFIDRAHLQLVLALHDPEASFETLRQAAENGTEVAVTEELPSRQRLCATYQDYISAQHGVSRFYDFGLESALTVFLNEDLFSLGFSQTILCDWLKSYESFLSQEKLESLALLCAKEGYGKALSILCQEKVDPNYYCAQETKFLLEIAVRFGHVSSVEALIKAGANIEVKTTSQQPQSLLFLAASCGYSAIAAKLIEAGSDINLKEMPEGRSPLMQAVLSGDIHTVQVIVRAQADIHATDEKGLTPLMLAVKSQNRSIAIIQILKEAGSRLLDTDHLGQTAFMMAAEYGALEVFSILMPDTCHLNMTDVHNKTALMLASNQRHVRAVRELIRLGADPHFRNSCGQNALMIAAAVGSTNTVNVFLEESVNLEIQDYSKQTALMKAVKKGSVGITQALIQTGASLDSQDLDGMTALGFACHCGFTVIADILIRAGADLNKKNHLGQTALMIAIFECQSEIACVLIKANAELNIVNDAGQTALMLAIKKGLGQVIKALIENDADINKQDIFGLNALLMAVFKGHSRVVKDLINARAQLDQQNKQGVTALMVAAGYASREMLCDLIEAGANLDLQDIMGKTALIIAVETNNTHIARALIDAGANKLIRDNTGKTALEIAESRQNQLLKELLEETRPTTRRRRDICLSDSTCPAEPPQKKHKKP